jgi:hypothetical protein
VPQGVDHQLVDGQQHIVEELAAMQQRGHQQPYGSRLVGATLEATPPAQDKVVTRAVREGKEHQAPHGGEESLKANRSSGPLRPSHRHRVCRRGHGSTCPYPADRSIRTQDS